MKESDSIVRTQVDALKELLDQSRNSHCSEVRDKAAVQARDIRKHARKQARERVRAAAREERERLEHEVRMVEAEIETEQRRRARRRDMSLIENGHSELAQALAQRWQDPAGRQAWAEAAVTDAAGVLLGRDWTLEHPADWPAAERDRTLALARERYGATIEARVVEGMESGVCIRSQGALVDMSVAGLLANERTIEGELLAAFNRAAEGEKS